MMSGAFSLINVLADSAGPGTVGMRGEHQDFFMVSAVMCLGTILLHTFWGVITFDALNRRKWLNLAFVWASHFTVSCLVRIWWTFSDLEDFTLFFSISDSVEWAETILGVRNTNVHRIIRVSIHSVPSIRRPISKGTFVSKMLKASAKRWSPSSSGRTEFHSRSFVHLIYFVTLEALFKLNV